MYFLFDFGISLPSLELFQGFLTDYVGVHPGEPDSVEFVKVLDDDVLVAS